MSILLHSGYFKFWSDHFNLANSTKYHYLAALKKFEAFLIKEGFEGELDFDRFHASREYTDRYLPIQRHVIDRFVLYLMHEEGLTNRSIASTITGLRRFFEFLHDMDMIEHNPMVGYPRPKFESPVQNTALSKEQCYALLRAAILRDPFYRQEFVFIWFMLITGLRISEVRFLRRKRVNFETRIVHVFEGQKTSQRPVAIPNDLTAELERYVQHPKYLKYASEGNEYLFHKKGKIMTVYQIRRMLSELSDNSNLNRQIRPHDLRRTAGYLMQIGGMNIVDIQYQLRHKNLGTTLRYVPPLADIAKILEDV
ncbi:tyrosine-type recombinase/integrase [Paenibacillus macerans]|uniref:tyrosine-type recombinase/integrase n=1 Tax=Paenibacillus macerans TaxID=44252 RepID=UPI003D31D7B2